MTNQIWPLRTRLPLMRRWFTNRKVLQNLAKARKDLSAAMEERSLTSMLVVKTKMVQSNKLQISLEGFICSLVYQACSEGMAVRTTLGAIQNLLPIMLEVLKYV